MAGDETRVPAHVERWGQDGGRERWFLVLNPAPGETVRLGISVELGRRLERHRDTLPTMYFRDPGPSGLGPDETNPGTPAAKRRLARGSTDAGG
jgi:hypothetical protein